MADKLTILFVEDEADIRDIVMLAMRADEDMELVCFQSGVDALDAVIQTGRIFDCALLNLRLPFMSGIELHEQLRQLPGMADLRTVLITAAVRPNDVEAYRRADIAGIISKPFDPMTLPQTVRGLLQPRSQGPTG
ncbi:response regulator [Sphingobium sp.]|uniref:response regulator n=1 Tax=Sphingobium sp. TaxID=1912891 RepID=UPI003BB6A566